MNDIFQESRFSYTLLSHPLIMLHHRHRVHTTLILTENFIWSNATTLAAEPQRRQLVMNLSFVNIFFHPFDKTFFKLQYLCRTRF